MSTTTTNYEYIKPETSDEIGQTIGTDMPSNLDKLDTKLKNLSDATDPKYFDYFKNMVYNSSFEIFDDATLLPTYWVGDGAEDPESFATNNFSGDYSCKLLPSRYVQQTGDGLIDPNWYNDQVTRVSFHRKLGQMKIEVYDHINSAYFTLTEADGQETPASGLSITTDATTNWQDSRVSVTFNPTEHESGGSPCTELSIKITNVHATLTGYVDCVMLTPDVNGNYPQIYKDGPKSRGTNGFQGVWTSATEPPDSSYLWLDIS